MRGLLSQIAADAEELTTQLLGPVPCEYLVVGLGSLSRADMTPYSDLEFGILLADASKSGYFRVLSAVMMMRMAIFVLASGSKSCLLDGLARVACRGCLPVGEVSAR